MRTKLQRLNEIIMKRILQKKRNKKNKYWKIYTLDEYASKQCLEEATAEIEKEFPTI